MAIELFKLEEKEFKRIYKLMEASFPIEEIRTYENGLMQLANPNYRILVSKNEGDKISGFIAEWDLGSILFLEHFAVDQVIRGLGIGSKMMEAYLKQATKPVMIEVEDDATDIGKRRIGFYRRAGFHLSEFGYNQPILRGNSKKEIPLKIMSFPEKLTKESFLDFKSEVFIKIYNVSDRE